jgi:muramoyltetrapeptide carboxypeptidase
LILDVELPPPAGPGDRVGVAALSGPVDPDRLEAGLDGLRGLGFVPVLADNVRSRHGLFAGSDAERLAAFHRLAGDRGLAAIFFVRGGWGALRLLPAIDWDLLAARPRAYVGYSDLTPFLLAVVRRLRLAAFHGPMVATDLARGLTAGESESLLAALAGRYPAAEPVAGWLRPGPARGPLLGGCLSLLASTVGTAFFPDLDGAVLLLEDVAEPAYRIDRMLTHLHLSGNLDRIQAMVVGHLAAQDEADPSGAVPRWAAGSLAGFSWPAAWGVASGHGVPNRTLPLGLVARLAPEAGAVVLGKE